MDIFLSYARSASRPAAEAVYRELGGDEAAVAFLDSEEIEHGDRFPQRLIDALLASRVVVIFAELVYFTRWYCILEFRAARAPFDHLVRRSGVRQEDLTRALESLCIVLPTEGARSLDLWNLPPELQHIHWPTASDPAAVAALVRRRLATGPPILAHRIESTVGADKFRREWLDLTRLPPPERIPPPEIPFAPTRGLPRSLGERFVGRADDLWRIHDTLTTRRGESKSVAALTGALEGGAGVGKSRLALEYLHRFGPRYYPGGLFWIDAERTLEPQYHQIARALDPATPDWQAVQGEPGGASDRLVSALRALPAGKPALVIVDNIPEPEPGEPPRSLEKWFPVAGNVHLLVTSRSRVSLGSEGAVVPLPVDVLDAGDAQALLTRGIDAHAIDPDSWREIVEWIDRLPLALDLLNNALAGHAFTASELLTRARSADTTAVLDQAMDALRAVVPAGSLRGATEALAFSYERLPAPAKPAARLLAWLAPAPVPESALDAFEAKDFPPSVRSLLVARSFVTEAPGATVPMFGSMHRVLGDFLRARSEDHQGELTRLTKALLSVMSRERVHTPSEWPMVEACEPHVATLFGHVVAQQPRSDFVDHTATLAVALASWYLAQGFPAAASDLVLQALAASAVETESGEMTVDTSRPAVHELTRLMGLTLTQSGEHDPAIDEQRTYLEWLMQVRAAESPEALAASDNLAWMLYERGHADDLEEAHQIFERTLPLWRRHDPASKDTLTALNNLALVEMKRGNVARAASMFEEVLKGLQLLENAEMAQVQTTWSLASLMWDAEPERAWALLEDALAVADRIQLPDKHWVKLKMLRQLGGTAHKRGEYARAQAPLRRTVQALAATQGEDASDTTVYAWALWDAQLRTGDIAAAAETRKRYLVRLIEATDEQLSQEQRRVRDDLSRREGPSKPHRNRPLQ